MSAFDPLRTLAWHGMKAGMNTTASVARVSAAVVSFFYMILLLPHLAGFEPENMTSGWYVAALTIAFSWVPILVMHARARQLDERLLLALSFAPMILFVGFFTLLFAKA